MRLSRRLTVAMVALVLIPAAAVGLLTYRIIETAILPSELEHVETDARLLASQLETYVRSARADIVAFRSTSLEGLIRARLADGRDPVSGSTEDFFREQLAARFAAEV